VVLVGKGRFKSMFEREDSGVVQRVEIVFLFFVWLTVAWLGFNSADQFIQNMSFGINTLMTIVSILWLLDIIVPNNKYVESIGFGKKEDAIKALVVGVFSAFGLIWFFSGSPVSIIPNINITITSVFVVVLMSIAEEAFFRSTLIPTLARLFKNDWVGAGIGLLAFPAFHLLVYGASPADLIFIFGLGAIFLAGNTLLKSTLFGYSMHFVYNLVRSGGLLLLLGLI
jgi:hypothetical protein